MNTQTSSAAAHSPNQSRLLLSHVRGGDYAHPGDEEAIEIVLEELKKFDQNIQAREMLDVGCGFGGTLNFLKRLAFKKVQGIDIDSNAINYAAEKYPGIEFIVEDITILSPKFQTRKFELITMFSVSYSIKDKEQMIQSVNHISEKGAILVIFDYASINALSVKDFSGNEMYPIRTLEFQKQLENHGWIVIKKTDLSDQFITWY